MAELSSGPISLTRYRPILYLFTGVVTTYAILYIRDNLLSSQPPSQSPLRRRNALRRPRPSDHELRLEDSPSYRAITHLELLERQNGMYGTFRIETEDGRRVESGLLPSLLATRDQLMEEVGVPADHAERMREMMEDTFLESFLALDFPSSHLLPVGSAERAYLTEQLQRRGISRAGIERALTRFNADENYGDELRRRRQNGERVTLSTSTYPDTDTAAVPPETETQDVPPVDDQSVFSWRDGNNDTSPTREGQNLLNLLYHIAEDQARRDGYIHRGVTCNSCGAMPIQGIRYRCANCIDYDLCETCEAMQVHIKTHLFYKVRIPAPFLGSPRQSQPVWYPGKPTMLPRSLPRPLAKRLMRETNFENTELDALWDQFRCLANYEWPDDPNKLHMAIDRKTFDRCFVPNTSINPPPPSLIYDRMFAFYDINGDNLIGFEEFLKGLASLNNKSNDERLRRVFRGYDIDGDGFVERKDFLRVFRAYYTLSRELTRDMVAGMEDDFLEGGARDVVLGGQPVSSAFPGNIPSGPASRTGEGKRINPEGDMEIVDNRGILREDDTDTGDRHQVIGDASIREHFGRTRPMFPSTTRLPNTATELQHPDPAEDGVNEDENDEEDDTSDSDESTSSATSENRPLAREQMSAEEIMEVMGTYVTPEQESDPFLRARLIEEEYNRLRDGERTQMEEIRRQGIDERWRRREFYTDEEDGAVVPDGYQPDPDLDEELTDEPYMDEQSESHPPSHRSRSSSKVRFEDDIVDDEDVRSNHSTSSRGLSVGERWGGYEIPEVEKDVGKEILYQVTQQGFNELLNLLFKPMEDLMMDIRRTRVDRALYAQEIKQYENSQPQQAPPTAKPGVVFPKDEEHLQEITDSRSLNDLLSHAGYAVRSPTLEPVDAQPVLAPPLPGGNSPDDDVRPSHLANPEQEDEFGQDHPFEEEYEDDDGDDDETASVTSSFNTEDQIRYSEYASFIRSSGYGSFEEAFDTDPGSSFEEITDYDPTLPQFRPDSYADRPLLSFRDEPTIMAGEEDLPGRLRLEPNSNISLPAPFSPHSSPASEETAPKPPPSPMQPLPPPPRAASAPREPYTPRRPTQETLAQWSYLNRAEREARERGGGAKLNFEEFSRQMAADKGRRLGFVASWIEMASF